MYSRALSSRSYVNLKSGQLPYQTQAEPTVNKNKSSRSKSVRNNRPSLKNPVSRMLSEPVNAANPLLTTNTPNFTCCHSQVTVQPAPQVIATSTNPVVVSQNPQMSTIVSTKSSVSNKTSSDQPNRDSVLKDSIEVLNEDIIFRIEKAFIRLIQREKLFNVRLVAIFYLNHGEVEAWCLVHNKQNDDNISSIEIRDDDEESFDELRNFELTQRIQAILRQYYNKTYQYVILYRDEDLSEYYRCIGIDRRRIKSERQNPASHFNNSCVSNACLQLKRTPMWKNFKKSLHL